jgi:hypothetical protein
VIFARGVHTHVRWLKRAAVARKLRLPGDVATRARLGAIAALAAAVDALGIGAYTAIQDYANPVFALGCVFLLAFFGWLVLTRDGLVRRLALPGALLGFVALTASRQRTWWPGVGRSR